MYKTSFRAGTNAAADQYGVQQPFPGDDQGAEQPAEQLAAPVKKKKSWLPALAAGAFGAGGIYAYMRHPSYSKNPNLAALQQTANKGGLHRVVDIEHGVRRRYIPDPDHDGLARVRDRFMHWMQPRVDPKTHQMDWANKLRFKLLEGPGAIPVTQRKINGGYVSYVPTEGRTGADPKNLGVKVDGLVTNRAIMQPDERKLIQGGQDVEGPLSVQKAHSQMDLGGKVKETQVMNRYAPGALPHTEIGVAKYLSRMKGKMSDVERARWLQNNIDNRFKGEYYMKPSRGVSSAGSLPTHETDWGDELRTFRQLYRSDRSTMNSLMQDPGGNDLSGYLRNNNALEGYTIHNALQNPRSVILQRRIPNYSGEWRLHVNNGAVLPTSALPRHDAGLSNAMQLMNVRNRKPMYEWAEKQLAKLPDKYRKGQFALDVATTKNPDGSTGYKLVEMNPMLRGTKADTGGNSGFLDTSEIPWMGNTLYRDYTGRHTPLVAGTAATVGGLGAMGVARALTPEEEEKKQTGG